MQITNRYPRAAGQAVVAGPACVPANNYAIKLAGLLLQMAGTNAN